MSWSQGGERRMTTQGTWLTEIKKWTGLTLADAMGEAKDREG